MNVHGEHYRTIWMKADDPSVVQIIDQRALPFHFVIEDLTTVDEVAVAIKEMHVRGAGLALYGPELFGLGGWITGALLIVFAFLGRDQVLRGG